MRDPDVVALFVQDVRTKVNLAVHFRKEVSAHVAGAISQAFGREAKTVSEGVIEMMGDYTCVFRLVQDVYIVGVCKVGVHPQGAMHMLGVVVGVLKSRGIKASAGGFKKRHCDVFLALEEVLNSSGTYAGRQKIASGSSNTPIPVANRKYMEMSTTTDEMIALHSKLCSVIIPYEDTSPAADSPRASGLQLSMSPVLNRDTPSVSSTPSPKGPFDFISASQRVGSKDPSIEETNQVPNPQVGEASEHRQSTIGTEIETVLQRDTPPVMTGSFAKKNYALSVLVQETISSTFVNGNEGASTVTGDVLLLGKGTIVEEGTPCSDDIPADVLYLRVENTQREEVRANPAFCQEVSEGLYKVAVKQKQDESNGGAPVCVLKYRKVSNPTVLIPLKAKLTWNSMESRGNNHYLDQVTVQWAMNPYIKISNLVFSIDCATTIGHPTKQQSKPESTYDAATHTLNWAAIQSGTTLLGGKLQARFQYAPPPDTEMTDELFVSHSRSHKPVVIQLDGTGRITNTAISLFEDKGCENEAVLVGGVKQRFCSGKGFVAM